MNNKLPQGFVLVTALLFLLLISLSILLTAESIILQHKLSQTWQQQQMLLARAEGGLDWGEANLTSSDEADGLKIRTTWLAAIPCVLTKDNQIIINYYQIISSADMSNADVTLAATYAKFPPGVTECNEIVAGRQSWRQVADDNQLRS